MFIQMSVMCCKDYTNKIFLKTLTDSTMYKEHVHRHLQKIAKNIFIVRKTHCMVQMNLKNTDMHPWQKGKHVKGTLHGLVTIRPLYMSWNNCNDLYSPVLGLSILAHETCEINIATNWEDSPPCFAGRQSAVPSKGKILPAFSQTLSSTS